MSYFFPAILQIAKHLSFSYSNNNWSLNLWWLWIWAFIIPCAFKAELLVPQIKFSGSVWTIFFLANFSITGINKSQILLYLMFYCQEGFYRVYLFFCISEAFSFSVFTYHPGPNILFLVSMEQKKKRLSDLKLMPFYLSFPSLS